jgi:hypothetical protein
MGSPLELELCGDEVRRSGSMGRVGREVEVEAIEACFANGHESFHNTFPRLW